MSLGDVVDELHDEDRLAHTGTAKEANLTALGVGLDQVDHLDAREQDLGGGAELVELRSGLVDLPRASRVDLSAGDAVDGLTGHVEEAALDGLARRHTHGTAHYTHGHAALQTLGGVHGDGADGVLTDVLLALHDERGLTFPVHLEGFQDLGEGHAGGETDVHDRTDDLLDGTDVLAHCSEN